jgi:hypothetical protein
MSDETVAGRGAMFSWSMSCGDEGGEMSCGDEGDELTILAIAVSDFVSLLALVSPFAYLLITLWHPSLYIYARAAGRERALPDRGL